MIRKVIFLAVSLLLLPVALYGAEFNALPSVGKFGLKQEFAIDIKIDSAGQSVNAAQAKLQFSPQILEVKSISKEGSVFNFWLQEPVFSNAEGKIEFIGGQVNGLLAIVNALVQAAPNLQTLGRAFASSADAQEKVPLNFSPPFLAGRASIQDGIKQLFVAAHQRK